MNNYFNKVFIVLVFISLAVSGCNKLIEIGAPKDQLVSGSVFEDSLTAEAAVTGMYSKIANMNPGTDMPSAISMFNGMSADEIYHFAYTFYDPFKNNALTSFDYYPSSIWSGLYNNIYIANSVIEGSSSTSLSESQRQRLSGQGKFIRAFAYFYLVNEFGAIPLVLSTDVNNTTNQPRDNEEKVYDQIEKDLLEAAAELPQDLNFLGGKRIQATSWTARALLSRVYLFRKKWAEAEAAATAVIEDQNIYRMLDNPGEVFGVNTEEGLLQFVGAFSSLWIANNFMPSTFSGQPNFVLTNELGGSFEPQDQRYSNWVGSINYGGTDYKYSSKYTYVYGSPVAQYVQVLRMAEQYLIRAEARLHQNNISGAGEDIDKVRDRAGLDPVSANDAVTMQTALEQEYRVEFFCEWGHRWLDLKRWPGFIDASKTRSDEVFSDLKGDMWQSTDALYPIPQTAINANPTLTQNAGY